MKYLTHLYHYHLSLFLLNEVNFGVQALVEVLTTFMTGCHLIPCQGNYEIGNCTKLRNADCLVIEPTLLVEQFQLIQLSSSLWKSPTLRKSLEEEEGWVDEMEE